jgi:uncharacterized protein with beta-barrel porin domain
MLTPIAALPADNLLVGAGGNGGVVTNFGSGGGGGIGGGGGGGFAGTGGNGGGVSGSGGVRNLGFGGGGGGALGGAGGAGDNQAGGSAGTGVGGVGADGLGPAGGAGSLTGGSGGGNQSGGGGGGKVVNGAGIDVSGIISSAGANAGSIVTLTVPQTFDFVGVGGGGGGGGGDFVGPAGDAGSSGELTIDGGVLTANRSILVGGAGGGASEFVAGGAGGIGGLLLNSGATLFATETFQIGGIGGDGGDFQNAIGGAGGGGTVTVDATSMISIGSAGRLVVGGIAGAFGSGGAGGAAGAGVLNLSGGLSFASGGTFTINSNGTLNFGNATPGAAVAGPVTGLTSLVNDGQINFNQSNASYSLSSAISGSGSLHQNGTGLTILSGASTYTGATTVSGGELIVNGSIAASSGLTVAPGATIGGTGVLPTTVITGGTISPGNSPGTLTVNGNLTLDGVSIYRAEVLGAASDWINVTGTAGLAGTLRLVPLGGAYVFSAPYTLLSAAGGLGNTTFGSVDTVGSFGDGITSNIAYTGTEVRLTLTPKPLAPILVDPLLAPRLGVGSPANALSVASGIDAAVAAGADPSLLFAIYDLPAAAIPTALNQLTGEVHTAVPAMANSAAGQFLGSMLDGMGSGRLSGAPGSPGDAGGSASDVPPNRDGTGRARLDPARFSLWGATFGSTGRNDGDRAVGSANRDLSDGHIAAGADLRLGNNTVVGAAVSGGQSRASMSGGLGKAEADIIQAGLYGRTMLGTVNLAAALGYARLDTDTTRAIPALARTGVAASYTTEAWSGRVEASLPVASWSGFTLSPLAAFQAVWARSPFAIERDGVGSNSGMLTLARRSDMTSRSELGLQLDAKLMTGTTPVTGFVRAAWTHYHQRDADLTASLNGLPGASFTAAGARPDRNAALVAAGADIRLSPTVSLGIRVDTELSGSMRRTGGAAQLRVSF